MPAPTFTLAPMAGSLSELFAHAVEELPTLSLSTPSTPGLSGPFSNNSVFVDVTRAFALHSCYLFDERVAVKRMNSSLDQGLQGLQ